MIWLTILGSAYIHNNCPILRVSNSLVLSIRSIVSKFARISVKNEGAKVVKK